MTFWENATACAFFSVLADEIGINKRQSLEIFREEKQEAQRPCWSSEYYSPYMAQMDNTACCLQNLFVSLYKNVTTWLILLKQIV